MVVTSLSENAFIGARLPPSASANACSRADVRAGVAKNTLSFILSDEQFQRGHSRGADAGPGESAGAQSSQIAARRVIGGQRPSLGYLGFQLAYPAFQLANAGSEFPYLIIGAI